MTGDCHVRFCERLRGETPLCLLGAPSFFDSLATYPAAFREVFFSSRKGAKPQRDFLCALPTAGRLRGFAACPVRRGGRGAILFFSLAP